MATTKTACTGRQIQPADSPVTPAPEPPSATVEIRAARLQLDCLSTSQRESKTVGYVIDSERMRAAFCGAAWYMRVKEQTRLGPVRLPRSHISSMRR